MNKDIEKMTPQEIIETCWDILDDRGARGAYLVGLIIAKLQEWECSTHVYNSDVLIMWHQPLAISSDSCRCANLQVAFLTAAQRLGHWKPKEEPRSYWMDSTGKIHAATVHAEAFSFGSEKCERVYPLNEKDFSILEEIFERARKS